MTLLKSGIIAPGRTVGILGGGQLGRMFALAARRMGYRIHVFDPTPDCPAGHVADVECVAEYDDVEAAERFAAGVDVVTFEFENVPAETLQAIAQLRPVHPSPEVLQICRHRGLEKSYLTRHGFPVAPHRPVHDVLELMQAVNELGTPCILKTASFGYDGKGQFRIDDARECEEAWQQLGTSLGVLEGFVRFSAEVSVIAARTQRKNRCFPPSENLHTRHILDLCTIPAGISPLATTRAIDLATAVADQLKVVGLLAVEMFLLPDDQLMINELAPRPHNSGHYTFDACLTNQFEQQLRAICGLPLGDVTLLRPAAMANLLGDLWETGEPNWAAALAFPEVKLHLYGKHEARPGRKMGHLTALADTPEEARRLAVAARDALMSAPVPLSPGTPGERG